MINEEEIIEKLKEVFYDKLTIEEFYYYIDGDTINLSKYNIIRRVLNSYSNAKYKKSSYCDFFSNLRQLINTFRTKFEISSDLAYEFKKIVNVDLYLDIYKLDEDKYLVISRDADFIWLKDKNVLNDFKKIYEDNMLNIKASTGDFRLKNLTGFNSYKSPCQKFVIRVLEKQQYGTTILSTMRTGGGKSLLVQYTSKYADSGTTIVVMPTIALTLDQYESSKKYFTDENRKVYAYCDGVSQSDKEKILCELSDGKVAILYISPESILNGVFYNKIMECAEKGILERLVIDEAHLISDWGEFFRTEFQFLAVFRRKILKLTNGRLKTLLVSATITQKSQEILKNLYSEEDRFIEIRGDSLRDEIEFYKIKCKNNLERKEYIKNIIPLVPKPAIIYVPIIESANEYYNLTKDLGFENVEMFTSETNSNARRKILKKWNEDKIDIIVATAAFGMGVDKKEVRSIIHTFIPESMDRLYQEVGRSGRDGYRSYSFLFTALKEDNEHIQYFTRNKVLSTNNIVTRWDGIIKNPYETISGDEYWISVRGIPEHLLENCFLGKTNEAWNEYVVLFLYRKNLIDILDVRVDQSTMSRLLLIKINYIDIFNDSDLFYKTIDKLRTIDRNYVDDDILSMTELIKDESVCWGKRFEKIYEYCEVKCSGCPVCRKNNLNKTKSEDYFEVAEGSKLITQGANAEIDKEIKAIIDLENKVCDNLDYLINLCNNEKVNSLILPDKEICDLVLNSSINNSMYLYKYDETVNLEEIMLRGKVAIVLLSGNDTINDELFRKYNKQYMKDKVRNLIYISDKDVYIKSECRDIERCVENVSFIRR